MMATFKFHGVQIEETTDEQARLAEMMRETTHEFEAVLDDIQNLSKSVTARMRHISEQAEAAAAGKPFALSFNDSQPQAARDLGRAVSRMESLRNRLQMERYFATQAGATSLEEEVAL